MFANADKENPNAHLHISQNINSQDYPFLGSCTLSANCYANMFEGCNMSSIPYTLLAPYDDVLSADEPSAQLILMSESYSQMFLNCPKIKSIPDELFHPRPNDPSPICGWDVGRVYYGMFSNCIGLNTLSPNLFQYITLEGNELIANMFSNCINLKIYDEKCSYESVLIIGKARLREGFKIPGVFEGCLCFGFDGTIIGGHNYYVGI
ncbi:MAG: hypothetical protein MJ219_00125 [Mycoplasmoidaceae bacterium]|nr:hypothetical protein [Mycoplasmoidaceae bacterium]